ncbi:venom acid phosphatase Acph-1-like isoform X2 [Fopius arisanus]|uniref:acid phosphatase n=1 Tax=Fopius arisanus TaxID=64838 RepID=A0A9R1UBE2_9HYME|nr:PREDICTED: venom acid phosphatase Acph-1-like isoform X2 [Fopius arisanus]
MRTVTYNCLLLSLLLIKSDGIDYKFVNVIFRHGDRTPQNNSYEIFPTSEYAKYRFDPYGYGQLTNKGKRNAYQLGIDIRDYYSQFLNDLYHPEEISAQSSDADRTKMSLQLVMAGIFPPSSAQSWNCKLNWQPVVTNYIPRDDDYVLNFLKCPNFKKEHDAVKKLPEVVEKVSQYSTFAKQLSEWTGVPITPTKHFVQIYHALTMLDHMGFASPHWSSRFYPEGLLLDGVALDFEILNYNERLRALSGGMVLKKFIDNMVAAADPNSNSRLKMELFSAHEIILALCSLNC